MKHILTACTILLCIAISASAQVSKTVFNKKISDLSVTFTKGVLTKEVDVYSQLNGLMQNEINYLTAQGSGSAAKLKIEKGLYTDISNLQAAIANDQHNWQHTNKDLLFSKLNSFAAQL